MLGAPGQPFSPHYMDHWNAWYSNKAFPLAFIDAGMQAAKAYELRGLENSGRQLGSISVSTEIER